MLRLLNILRALGLSLVMIQFCHRTNSADTSSHFYRFHRCQQCYHRPTQNFTRWTDQPVASCGIRTLQRYPDSFSFSFNRVSKICTPGLSTEISQSWADQVLNMVMCDASKGFKIFKSGLSISCFGWFQYALTYAEADNECRSKGGYLMTPKTIEKLRMLRGLVTKPAWVGLEDTIQEGVFIWTDDHSTLTTEVNNVVFNFGEPDDSQRIEDCVLFFGTLHDVSCSSRYTFLCEIFTINL